MQLQSETPQLDPATVTQLQKLIRMNIDSADGFATAAEVLQRHDLAARFRAAAIDRTQQAAELQRFVGCSGEVPEHEGTVLGSLRRGWRKLRAAVTSGDATVLADAEHGEDILKKGYEKAILATSASPVSDVLHRHFARIGAQHDLVKTLRDHLA